MKSASFFWPGSDVEIQGTRPSIYHPYDGKITNEDRVNEVASWLKLPPEKRPHFMTVYFSDVDHEGIRSARMPLKRQRRSMLWTTPSGTSSRSSMQAEWQ